MACLAEADFYSEKDCDHHAGNVHKVYLDFALIDAACLRGNVRNLFSYRLVKLNLQYDHFSYIFIDEASQGTELESLIPFTIVSSQSKVTEGTLHAQVIIAGDHHQLGPVVRCKKIQHLLGEYKFCCLVELNLHKLSLGPVRSDYIFRKVTYGTINGMRTVSESEK